MLLVLGDARSSEARHIFSCRQHCAENLLTPTDILKVCFCFHVSVGTFAWAYKFNLFVLILVFCWNFLMVNHAFISLVILPIFSKHLSH